MSSNAKDYDSDQYGVMYLECGHYVDSENSFFRSLSDFADKTEG